MRVAAMERARRRLAGAACMASGGRGVAGMAGDLVRGQAWKSASSSIPPAGVQGRRESRHRPAQAAGDRRSPSGCSGWPAWWGAWRASMAGKIDSIGAPRAVDRFW